MLCQNCQQRNANICFTQVINNNKVDLYLCESCARENGQLSIGMPINISNFFGGLMGYGGANQYISKLAPQQIICKKCGMSYEEFQRTGKLGCDNCYGIYSERLKPLVRRLHGNIKHTGKVPSKITKTIKASKEIEELKELLGQAIQNEEYEKAAELRDKIKSVEVVEG